MPVSTEVARDWAEQAGSAKALRVAVRDRLLAKSPMPLAGGKGDEYPEDVICALLQDEELPEERKVAVASGWNAALGEVERLLRDPGLEYVPSEREALAEPFERVFRVAEMTGHPLLESGVMRSALPLAVDPETRASTLQVQQVVAAARAFPARSADREVWLEAMRGNPDIAGYAFLALLDLDEEEPGRVVAHVLELMARRYLDGWDLDVWYLTEFVRARLGPGPIETAMLLFSRRYPEVWLEASLNSQDDPCWPHEADSQLAKLSEAMAVEVTLRQDVAVNRPAIELKIVDEVISDLHLLRGQYAETMTKPPFSAEGNP